MNNLSGENGNEGDEHTPPERWRNADAGKIKLHWSFAAKHPLTQTKYEAWYRSTYKKKCPYGLSGRNLEVIAIPSGVGVPWDTFERFADLIAKWRNLQISYGQMAGPDEDGKLNVPVEMRDLLAGVPRNSELFPVVQPLTDSIGEERREVGDATTIAIDAESDNGIPVDSLGSEPGKQEPGTSADIQKSTADDSASLPSSNSGTRLFHISVVVIAVFALAVFWGEQAKRRSHRDIPTTIREKISSGSELDGQELLVNRSCEAPLQAGKIVGWRNAHGQWQPRQEDPLADHGKNYFYAGKIHGRTPNAELIQDVSIEHRKTSVDSGDLYYSFRAKLCSWHDKNPDLAQVRLEFLREKEEGDEPLSFFTSRPTICTSHWRQFSSRAVVPKGTRRIRVRLVSIWASGRNSDGYFDDLSLKVSQSMAELEQSNHRDRWEYRDGDFELQPNGKWRQTHWRTQSMFNEVLRNVSCIELASTVDPIQVRLYKGKCEVKRFGGEFKYFRDGNWCD